MTWFIKSQVMTMPVGAKQNQQTLWIHCWFLLVFLCRETREIIQSNTAKSFPVPVVLDIRHGFTVDHFIQHILINEFDGKLKNERRLCCYQWKEVLIEETFGDNNSEVSDDMESSDDSLASSGF